MQSLQRNGRVVLAAAVSALFVSTAAYAADVDSQRLLNADKEPGNWMSLPRYATSPGTTARSIRSTRATSSKLHRSVVACRLARQPRPAGFPSGHRRRAVLLEPVQPGLRAGRRHRQIALDLQAEAQRGSGRPADPFAVQPRHRRRLRQHLHGHARRQAGGDRHEDRQAQLGNQADRLREAHRRIHRRHRCW